jgi:hypothetical protein
VKILDRGNKIMAFDFEFKRDITQGSANTLAGKICNEFDVVVPKIVVQQDVEADKVCYYDEEENKIYVNKYAVHGDILAPLVKYVCVKKQTLSRKSVRTLMQDVIKLVL